MQIQKLKTVDADTLLSTPIRKTLFVVDGLIPQGLSVLSGPSKIGKSWLMLWLALREGPRGGRWWVLHVLLWAALLGSAAALLCLIPFDLVLPEPLTETNILRPAFYVEHWISAVQRLRRSPSGPLALTVWNLQALWGILSFVLLAHTAGACARLVNKNTGLENKNAGK